MVNNENIYDYSDTELSKLRKNKFIREHKQNMYFGYFIIVVFIFLLLFLLQFLLVDIIFGLIGFIVIGCVFLIYYFWFIKHSKKAIISESLDYKIFPDYLELPDWDKFLPDKTMKLPLEFIDRIFWNDSLDYFIILITKNGKEKMNLRNNYNTVYKESIDDINHYKEILIANNVILDMNQITWEQCYEKYGKKLL